jgi:hypothetical protein
MQRVAHGDTTLKGLTPEKAREFIHKTPKKKRSAFAKVTAKRRGTYG